MNELTIGPIVLEKVVSKLTQEYYNPGTEYYKFEVIDLKSRYFEIPWNSTCEWVEKYPLCIDIVALETELEDRLSFFKSIDGMIVGNYKKYTQKKAKTDICFRIPSKYLERIYIPLTKGKNVSISCVIKDKINTPINLPRIMDLVYNFNNTILLINDTIIDSSIFTKDNPLYTCVLTFTTVCVKPIIGNDPITFTGMLINNNERGSYIKNPSTHPNIKYYERGCIERTFDKSK